MIKKLIVVFFVCVINIVPVQAMSFPWETGKDKNILFVFKYLDKVNFCAVKYSPENNCIKACFVDENIFVRASDKKKKLKPLKEIFFETEENKQISIAKTEIEKIFNNKIKFDNYVLFDDKFLNKITEIFLPQQFPNDKNNLLNVIACDDDRYNVNIALIKITNGVYGNINRWTLIELLKSFYKSDFVFKTDFKFTDALFGYSDILNENKVLKYADVPVETKRNITRVDSLGIEKIIDFLSDSNEYDDKNLKIEVLNATNKSRLAIKAADKLRGNSFDVFDWGSSSIKYKFTIIFDFIDSYKNSSEIKKVLNCGEIIFLPEERDYTDISVSLGDDCVIYDKLDRTTETTGEKVKG